MAVEYSSLEQQPQPTPRVRDERFWLTLENLVKDPSNELLVRRLKRIETLGRNASEQQKSKLLDEVSIIIESHLEQGRLLEVPLSPPPIRVESVGSERFSPPSGNNKKRGDFWSRARKNIAPIGLAVSVVGMTLLSGCSSWFGQTTRTVSESKPVIASPPALTLDNLGIVDRKYDSRYPGLGTTDLNNYIGYRFEARDPVGIEDGGVKKYDYSALGDDHRDGGRMAADTVNYLVRTYNSAMMSEAKFSAVDKQTIEELKNRPFDPARGSDLELLRSIKRIWGDVYEVSYDMLLQDETRALSTINKINLNSPTKPVIREEKMPNGEIKKVVWVPHPLSMGIPRAAVPRGDLPGYFELPKSA
jgi:hypothetical protein